MSVAVAASSLSVCSLCPVLSLRWLTGQKVVAAEAEHDREKHSNSRLREELIWQSKRRDMRGHGCGLDRSVFGNGDPPLSNSAVITLVVEFRVR